MLIPVNQKGWTYGTVILLIGPNCPNASIGPKAEFPCAFPTLRSTATAKDKISQLSCKVYISAPKIKKAVSVLRQPLILFLLVNLRSGIKKVSRMLRTKGLSLTPSLCQINCTQAEKGFINSKRRSQILPGYIAKNKCKIPTDLACFCTFSKGLGIQEATSIVIPKISRANWVFRASTVPYTQSRQSCLHD